MAEDTVNRLFFALWPDAEVRARLAELSQRIPAGRARAVHPEDLHLTLQFLGPVPEPRIPCLLQAATELIASAPASIELSLNRLGYWKRPRVVWVGPEETPVRLSDLVKALGARLASCGYPPEARPYVAHITLARKGSAGLLDELEPLSEIPWSARELVLVESLSVARPPRYKILHSWPL